MNQLQLKHIKLLIDSFYVEDDDWNYLLKMSKPIKIYDDCYTNSELKAGIIEYLNTLAKNSKHIKFIHTIITQVIN